MFILKGISRFGVSMHFRKTSFSLLSPISLSCYSTRQLLGPISPSSDHLRLWNRSHSLRLFVLFNPIPFLEWRREVYPNSQKTLIVVTDFSGRIHRDHLLSFEDLLTTNSTQPVSLSLVAGQQRIECLNFCHHGLSRQICEVLSRFRLHDRYESCCWCCDVGCGKVSWPSKMVDRLAHGCTFGFL
jgi:hypothetical protein